ncbi:hypothetical protein D3874_08965 [Oleomonas cavernae]|uniref:Uncharacterized protein n=1 Tax=Oleomonas cavernae TaxID=2320859 RepID=A0A418WAV4_9PROT|nr:hypothetical protein [Oleomonas cavernae]RJF87140.1 hypothetical protein D3874_08965 [Oleomonas cavernae]
MSPQQIYQFTDDLDRFGPDLSLWPADRLGDASRLLATSATARALLDDAVRIAGRLARPAPEVSALKARILAAARAGGQAMRDNVVPFRARPIVTRAGMALAASLVFGLFVGWTGMISDPLSNSGGDDLDGSTIQALIVGDNYDS